jgi:hypothetical protein
MVNVFLNNEKLLVLVWKKLYSTVIKDENGPLPKAITLY